MKKNLSLFTSILFITTCYSMETSYVLNEKEKKLNMEFNVISDRLNTWISKYSIEQLDKMFSSQLPQGKKITQEHIKTFTQKPMRGKTLSLKAYTFTELKKALENNNTDSFFIKNILHNLMLEAVIYYKMHRLEKKYDNYFSQLLKELAKVKEKLYKPI